MNRSATSTDDHRRRFRRGDRLIAIVNPSTRLQVNTLVGVLEERCPPGVQIDIVLTRRNVDTSELVRSRVRNVSGIIAVGGDGTVSAVASGLTDTSVPLGIIPGGSTNIIAQEMGIPADLHGAADLIFGEFDERPLDVGMCNDRPFLHMAGAGWDSQTFATTDRDLKKRIGWLAYIPAAMKVTREPAHLFRLTVDDEILRVQSPLVLIANGSSIISPNLRLGHAIRSDDGELNLVICTATRPHEIANILARFTGGTLEDSPYVISRRAKRIVMETVRPVEVQLDGDVVESTPAAFRVLPRAIHVIVPTDVGRSWRFQAALAGIT